jgi:hypothetical protein
MPNPKLGTAPPPKDKPKRLLWSRIALVGVPVLLLLLPFYLDWWEVKAARRQANTAKILSEAWADADGSLIRIPPGASMEFKYFPDGLTLRIVREPLSGSQKGKKVNADN